MNKPDILIKNKIHTIRGLQVMLDSDLAELYEVEIRSLNQAVKRNKERFPEDFVFQLIDIEHISLRSQFVTLKTARGTHRKYLPYAFTEQGVAMLSGVLKSKKAAEVNVKIMRALRGTFTPFAWNYFLFLAKSTKTINVNCQLSITNYQIIALKLNQHLPEQTQASAQYKNPNHFITFAVIFFHKNASQKRFKLTLHDQNTKDHFTIRQGRRHQALSSMGF